ncbi:cyclin-domain-containing protein [Protomyces lactucae-debilis]|uniref:Cyclin-domain-containing protein n=1 Tax=Protomyces lactucae-debilis TaxID=2754530 RepID=A0A1Y2FJW6_PROLT|nr:cyclin-domain-containing protein [Protomyces lactucae-debilis]ORY84229.1 cyclin-domain-containing protein [Protomyces lactucae-debilis]
MQQPKHIPPHFYDADTQDLVVLIADMIHQLIAHNDRLPLTPAGLTRFHSRAPPAISVQDYLSRIVRYTSLERIALLSTVVYIDRLCSAFPAFVVSSLTIHRFLITATTVASKGLCDAFCTNTHYAKVGGVTLSELNVLELEFLAKLGWRILSNPQELQTYYVNLSLNSPKFKRMLSDEEQRLLAQSPPSQATEATQEETLDAITTTPIAAAPPQIALTQARLHPQPTPTPSQPCVW